MKNNSKNDVTGGSKDSKKEIWALLQSFLLYKLITYVPVIIFLWMVWTKLIADPVINSSLALFIAGFTGILRNIVGFKNAPSFSQVLRGSRTGWIVVTLFCWGLALYSYLHG